MIDIIGSSQRGFADGELDSARFDKPQGMALDGELLYIADVNNHAIRLADLAAREVYTIAGNGTMGQSGLQFGVPISNPLGVTLRSPWDVELDDGGLLHIAMAGTHQLYVYEPESGVLYPSVGNGREANLNGVSLANAELAQPSGLYYAGEGKLYFADSESSTIRLADFANDLVSVASGTTANNLFDFGDVDGELGSNRLQHALGIEGGPDGALYIADTYNSRIKVIPAGETATLTAFGLGGLGGSGDGDASEAAFDEPGGISYANGILYVADTNNHVIRTIDLEAGIVETLQFSNPEALAIDRDTVTLLGGNSGGDTVVRLETQPLTTGDGAVNLTLSLPPDFKINPLIDSQLTLTDESGIDTTAIVAHTDSSVTLAFSEGSGDLNAELTLYYCREGAEALCFIETVTWVIPYEAAPEHSLNAIALDRTVFAPDI